MNNVQTLPSIAAAHKLREAGLEWQPREGDRFHIPDRGFDENIWTVSEMVIEARYNILGERELAFNGTVEWALDSIVKSEVVWVPSEGQLRELLGDHFIALYADDEAGFVCVARVTGDPRSFPGATAADAYAAALLAIVESAH